MAKQSSAETAFDMVMLRDGTPEQRATLLNQFRDYLRTIARDRLEEQFRNQLSVSDFVQRTIIQADQCIDQCRAKNIAQFKGWLRQILIHEIFNRKRHAVAAKRNANIDRPLDSRLADSQTSPSQRMIEEEEKSILLEAIQKLPEEYQFVILARHRDEQSFNEIGEQLNKSPDAARMLWQRAVKQLSRLIGSDASPS